jgi:glycosyltransferase involved in cell wall biosynthesis
MGGPPPPVLLVRAVEGPRQPSMRRFGSELDRALRASGRARVAPSLVLAALPLGPLEPALSRYVRLPFAVRRRRRFPGVVHLTDQSHAHLLALLPAARTVVTCHDLVLLRSREGGTGFPPRRRALARFDWSTSFLGRAARIVCPSEATRADVVRLRGIRPERVAVVPNGVGAHFRPPRTGERKRLREELGLAGPMVLHVSSGQPYKNVEATLRVGAALRDGGLPVTLVRVGARLGPAELATARRYGLEGAVLELGEVEDRRLAQLYGAADVLLFPSYIEGFGWPALEAMACGTPVVVSRDRALQEVVGDAGLCAGADDVPGLTAAVRSVLEDPALAAGLGARGLERAGRFSWGRTATGYADVYAEVAGG